ncbi:MAG: hypothetical protein RMJ98_17320 [Myxococcales bacterium]|nr:hypothetical protein [Polyangiaceae bacterium]MDW8251057.1 hypothetical protein [Myxococcales bacterium]
MPDFSGFVPSVEVALLLWALPLLPLAGALLSFRMALLDEEPDSAALWAAPVSIGLALLAAVALAYRLAVLPGASRVLVAPGPTLLCLGSIDLHLGLSLDAFSSLASLLLLTVASLAQVGLATSSVTLHRLQGTLGTVAGATAAGLLALLASCPLVMVIGSGLLTLLGALACGASGPGSTLPKGVALPLIGDVLLWGGAAVVTWGLTGTWGADGFIPAVRPYFVAVVREGEAARPTAPQGQGYLTLTTNPGARVFLDNRLEPFAEAPFVRHPLSAGPHSISVEPGPGMDRVELRKIRVEEGSEVVLVRAQGANESHGIVALCLLKEGREPVVARGRLGSVSWGGLPVSVWVAVLLLAGFLLRVIPPVAPVSSSLPRTLRLLVPQVGGVLLAVLAAVRWLPLLGVESGWSSWLLVFPLAGTAMLALLGLVESQPARALGFGASSCTLLAISAAAAGAPEAALLQGAVVALALALALWGLALIERQEAPWELAAYQGTSTEPATRWLKLAYAGLLGLLPLGFGVLEVARALGVARWLLPVLVPLLGASLGRVIYIVTEGKAPSQESRNLRRREASGLPTRPSDPVLDALLVRLSPVLGVVLVTLGPMGAATLYEAPVASWLASAPALRSSLPPVSASLFAFWAMLSPVALLGARWARSRYGEHRPGDWEDQEKSRLPQALLRVAGQALRRAFEGVTSAAARFSHGRFS